jgi:hypothetical protein
MWTAAAGIFSKIFGSSKVINGAVDGIDKMFYTNEERAEQKVKLLAAFEPFKLALRFLAMVISIPYVLMVMALFVSKYFDFDITEQFELLKDTLTIPFTIVVSFYFADGIGIFKGKKNIKTK